MRKAILWIVAACLLAPLPASAQHEHSDLHHEIGVTAGPVSGLGSLVYGTVGFFEALGSSISKRAVKMDLRGHYGLHYYYQVKWWCQVGVKATFENARTTRYTDTTQLVVSEKSDLSICSLMPSVRFTYLNRPWVRLYSGIDLGIGFVLNQKRTYTADAQSDPGSAQAIFAFNITPIGVNVGKRFFGMFETNIGLDSFVKVGIGARF